MPSHYRFPAPVHCATADAFERAVFKFLLRSALREMLRRFRAGEDQLDGDTLDTWVYKLMSERGRRYIVDYQDRASKGMWDGEKLERLVFNVTLVASERFDPVTFLARAAAGGRANRKIEVSDLAATDGMSIPESAAFLGCSTSTISRRRAEHRERIAATRALHAELLNERIEVLA